MYGRVYIFDEDKILDIIGQETIMSLALNDIIDTTKMYRAPYRRDEHAGCRLSYHKGILYFVDFADTSTHKRAITLLGKVLGKSKLEVLIYLCDKFELYNIDYKGHTPKRREDTCRHKEISYKVRAWSHADIRYWGRYGISIEHLDRHRVVPIYSYTIEGRTFIMRDIAYGYTDFDGGRIKIYMPRNGQFRFVGNVRGGDVGMMRHLPLRGSLVIITKSFKDAMIIRNAGYEVVWLQSEMVVPQREVIYSLTRRFREVVVFFDNDKTGVVRSKELVRHITGIDSTISCREVAIADTYCKDMGEYVEEHGLGSAVGMLGKLINKR